MYSFSSIHPIGESDPTAMPVRDSESAARYYTDRLDFTIRRRIDSPVKTVVVGRDGIEIGLVENGGNPDDASCYIAVDDVDAAHREIEASGLQPSGLRIDEHAGSRHKVFFIKDDEGLCYCIGTRLEPHPA